MKEGRKPTYPEKNPDDELQKMPHNKTPKFQPRLRLEPTLKHWWQARKADMLTITLLQDLYPMHSDGAHTDPFSISSKQRCQILHLLTYEATRPAELVQYNDL